jgi:hypothetical protein
VDREEHRVVVQVLRDHHCTHLRLEPNSITPLTLCSHPWVGQTPHVRQPGHETPRCQEQQLLDGRNPQFRDSETKSLAEKLSRVGKPLRSCCRSTGLCTMSQVGAGESRNRPESAARHQEGNCETKPISILLSINGKLSRRFAVTECGYWGARF